MASASRKSGGRDGVLLTLDGFILALNIAKDACGLPPVQAAFGSASTLLTTIRDTVTNQQDYIEFGKVCADVCKILDRGLKGKRLDGLSQSILEAIEQFTTAMATIQGEIIKQGKRRAVSQFFHSKIDKDKIAAWRLDILRILQIFDTELSINTHVLVAELHQNQDGTSRQLQSGQASSSLGELPPPAPRSCLGRDALIEEVVRLAESLQPIALIGAGGIGKTSVALSALHNHRIKARFGDNRRFIRCDQFPASRAHFLARLSKVIGAGVENPEDLTPLRPLLSSKEIFIFLILDNVESILDPQGTDASEIYAIVNELCQFETISVCITSRITTVPRHCVRPEIPTLSMSAACDIFYGIYGDRGGRSDIINNLLERLDFHALSITLLATTASHNSWNYNRLVEEWRAHRAQVLRTDYNESLAATIELSLNSPTFRKLGPPARHLLEVIAFFPQGVDEKKLDRLFPTIPDIKAIFDKFRVLSLSYQSNGFITMLAPIRDYLRPQDPKLSPLLCEVKDRYFTWLSVEVYPDRPGFGEARWITLEDVNAEHLLSVFMFTDADRGSTWGACIGFLDHLYWYKPRETTLAKALERLPDDHHFKPLCLFRLSRLFQRLGNQLERKGLLAHTLELGRQRGDDIEVARTLRDLSDANRMLGLNAEGIQLSRDALEIHERLGDTSGQAHSLKNLASLLVEDRQLDAAEDAASRAIELISARGENPFLVCESHRLLGDVYRRKGEKANAIRHFEAALRIASPLNWHHEVVWNHLLQADLFRDQGELEEANAHIEQARSYATNEAFDLGHVMMKQAVVWGRQARLEDATSEALRALDIFEKLGAAGDVKRCRNLLRTLNEFKG